MTLWRRRPTDEQFVERWRAALTKLDRWRTWLIWFHTALLIAAVAASGEMLNVVVKLGIFPFQGNQALIAGGFFFGAAFGVSIGALLFKVVHLWLGALFGYRAERLMVRCHDRCHSCQAAEESADNHREEVEVF